MFREIKKKKCMNNIVIIIQFPFYLLFYRTLNKFRPAIGTHDERKYDDMVTIIMIKAIFHFLTHFNLLFEHHFDCVHFGENWLFYA